MSAHEDMEEARLIRLAEEGATAEDRAAAVAALLNLAARRHGAGPAWRVADEEDER